MILPSSHSGTRILKLSSRAARTSTLMPTHSASINSVKLSFVNNPLLRATRISRQRLVLRAARVATSIQSMERLRTNVLECPRATRKLACSCAHVLMLVLAGSRACVLAGILAYFPFRAHVCEQKCGCTCIRTCAHTCTREQLSKRALLHGAACIPQMLQFKDWNTHEVK